MRNNAWDRENTLKNRPLPSCCPELIPVVLRRSEHKGREQWVSSFPVYQNGKDSDRVDIVVNFDRWTRNYDWRDGDEVWVRPTAMAPQKRLIFAQFERKVRVWPDEVFPHRIDHELDVAFTWDNQEKCYVNEWQNGWLVKMIETDLRLSDGEAWKVKVIRVDVGLVSVAPVGPGDSHVVVLPPEQLAYLQVKSLHGKALQFEGDVMAYRQSYGGTMELAIETDDDVMVFSVEHLRRRSRYEDVVIGTFTRHGHHYGQLCEFVWVEGEPASTHSVWEYQRRRRHARPTPRERQEDRSFAEQRAIEADEEAWQIDQDYLDEIRYNTEPPDYD